MPYNLKGWVISRDSYGTYHASTNGIKVEADTRNEALRRLKQAYKAHMKAIASNNAPTTC